CECLTSNSACSGLTPWQYALIFLSVAALGVIGFILYRFRLRIWRNKWLLRRNARVGSHTDVREAFTESSSQEMATLSSDRVRTTESAVMTGTVGSSEFEEVDVILPGATCPSPCLSHRVDCDSPGRNSRDDKRDSMTETLLQTDPEDVPIPAGIVGPCDNKEGLGEMLPGATCTSPPMSA
ncbi:PREDICTED: uncharacterized protein LOC109478382, partial [Branchiostoma belcheri]|uniref:Uncharacterized protein LOC109478382 n=1 Tax=Branchiostoma belcheri TaxID=7741 RepID=A0A6P4Z1N3_BRABE